MSGCARQLGYRAVEPTATEVNLRQSGSGLVAARVFRGTAARQVPAEGRFGPVELPVSEGKDATGVPHARHEALELIAFHECSRLSVLRFGPAPVTLRRADPGQSMEDGRHRHDIAEHLRN